MPSPWKGVNIHLGSAPRRLLPKFGQYLVWQMKVHSDALHIIVVAQGLIVVVQGPHQPEDLASSEISEAFGGQSAYPL